jgi:hypothetical protein
VLALMLDASSKRGAALRAALPGGTPPALPQLFSVGQFVRCVVAQLTSTAAGGEQDEAAAAADAGAGEACYFVIHVALFCCCWASLDDAQAAAGVLSCLSRCVQAVGGKMCLYVAQRQQQQ